MTTSTTINPASVLNFVITEDSAATDFIERHGENIRYCHTTGAWFIFKTMSWRKDETGETFQMIRVMARQISDMMEKSKLPVINKTSFSSGVERFAKSDQQVAVTHDYWDADPWLLGTPGGTVDLRTGQLREPRREDAITKMTSVAPNNDGCPLWLQFLLDSTGGDQEFIRFLQQWWGYCLTGHTREHALVFVYGPGGNGKTVFLNIMTRIFGDYAATAAMDTFTSSKNDKHPTDLAKLRGARLVTASETEAGKPWAEARIKNLTGGDRISARFMRQDFFEYDPNFKLMIVGNHMPVLANVDDAVKRRFNIVPFILTPPAPDPELEEKLILEAGGIMQWAIQGCLDWQKNRLVRPQSVQAATKQYFDEQDMMGQWIDEACVVEQPGGNKQSALSGDLFSDWSEFCKKAGEEPGSKKAFGSTMQKRGFTLERDSSTGHRLVRGIRLKV